MFRLSINTENEAFDDASELPWLLRRIARYVEEGRTEGPITDSNGNHVGHWSGAPCQDFVEEGGEG